MPGTPYRVKVVVTDPDEVDYELGSELRRSKFFFRYKRASNFELLIKNTGNQYTDAYPEGSIVTAYIDKNNPPTTRRFQGLVELPDVDFPRTVFGNYLTLTGRDLFGLDIAERKHVGSYTSMEIADILKAVCAEDLPEYGTTGIQNTGITMSRIYGYKWVKEIFDEMAAKAGSVYGVDYSQTPPDIFFAPGGSLLTGINVVESDIDNFPKVSKTILPVKNIIWGFGGWNITPDQSQTTVTHTVDLESYWWAVQFQPTGPELRRLDLYLSQSGGSVILRGHIREDAGDTPQGGAIIWEFARPGVTSAGWYVMLGNVLLDTAKKYWIVLEVVTPDAYNHLWYRDNGSSGRNAYSSDGVTWTVQSSSYKMAFKTYYGYKIVVKAETPTTSPYRRREDTFSDPTIIDREIMRAILQGLLQEKQKVRKNIPGIPWKAYNSSIFPLPGKSLAVNWSSLNLVNVVYTIDEAVFEFGVGRNLEACYYVPINLTGSKVEGPDDIIAELRRDVQTLKAGVFGPSEGMVVDMIRQVYETLNWSATATVTVQTTGTFLVGTARVGFSDCA